MEIFICCVRAGKASQANLLWSSQCPRCCWAHRGARPPPQKNASHHSSQRHQPNHCFSRNKKTSTSIHPALYLYGRFSCQVRDQEVHGDVLAVDVLIHHVTDGLRHHVGVQKKNHQDSCHIPMSHGAKRMTVHRKHTSITSCSGCECPGLANGT